MDNIKIMSMFMYDHQECINNGIRELQSSYSANIS